MWNEIKLLVASTPVLAFYDTRKYVTIQGDASQNGLGATLLQEGRPVSYASRALTSAEKNYAQIEKELLAIVFACERFDQYVYGRQVTVESDHQPLESIAKKRMEDVPNLLQRMLLRLQRYDLQITYKKFTELYIADTLSRAFLQEPNQQSKVCVQLEEIRMSEGWPEEETQLDEIREATSKDEELQCVMQLISREFPATKRIAPTPAHPYFNCRFELSVQNGIVYKGDRIIIPRTLRSQIIKRIHSSHLGVEGCLRRAREALYWPNMNTAVRDSVSTCDVCNSFQPEQQQEPLLPQKIPDRPWSQIGVDLFELQDTHYVIAVDYYSNFFLNGHAPRHL